MMKAILNCFYCAFDKVQDFTAIYNSTARMIALQKYPLIPERINHEEFSATYAVSKLAVTTVNI